MSRFETTLTTRGYEVDGSGVLPASLYLRFMEQARWEALAASPPLAALFDGEHRMVVVAQRLALGSPIGHGVTLRSAMGIARLGRSSVDFAQRLWRDDGVEPEGPGPSAVAEGLVVAVYCDAGGRPTALPDRFRREHALAAAPPALPLPAVLDEASLDRVLASGAEERCFSAEAIVRPSDCDLLQHANHASYLTYFDDARQLAAARGVFAGAAGAPLRGAALDYRREARAGDVLQVRVAALSGDDALGCVLLGDGQVRCTGRLLLGSPRA